MLVGDWHNVVVLQAVAELRKAGLEMNFSFLNYAQSSQCRNWQDSSVSYAAGALIVHWGQLSRGPLQRRHSALNIYRHNLSHTPYLSPSYAHNLQEGQRHSKPIQFSPPCFQFEVSPRAFGWSAVLRLCRTKIVRGDEISQFNLAWNKHWEGGILYGILQRL